MTKDWQADVRQFMIEVKEVGVPTTPNPAVLMNSAIDHRAFLMRLIDEEATELRDHLLRPDYDDVTAFTDIADDLADLIYVTLQAANALGINLSPIWEEVQRSNMAKKGGETRADGKQLKPTGWTPPNLRPLIEDQIHGIVRVRLPNNTILHECDDSISCLKCKGKLYYVSGFGPDFCTKESCSEYLVARKVPAS